MRSGDQVPRVGPEANFSDLMREMSAKGLGCSAIVDAAGHIQGIFTDGDLRRALERGPIDFSMTPVSALMGRQPKTVPAGHLAVEAAHLLEQHRVNGLLVVDDGGRLVGALNIHDLLQARVL